MPVLEDGLSDSENISGDEHSPPVRIKSANRHQSTQSDFLVQSNPSSLLPSHKQQFAKSTQHEPESQVKTSSTRSQVSASTTTQTKQQQQQQQQQRTIAEETPTVPTGNFIYQKGFIERVNNLDAKPRKKGLFRMLISPPPFFFVMIQLICMKINN